MDTMAVSKFKATCLAVLEKVRQTGETILVTKHGKPLAQVMPPPPPETTKRNSFGCMAGTAEIVGDILEPLPEEDWEVLR